jgi:hypothetical protein
VAGGGPRTAHSQPSSRLDPWGVGVPGLDRLQSEAAAGKFLQPDLGNELTNLKQNEPLLKAGVGSRENSEACHASSRADGAGPCR